MFVSRLIKSLGKAGNEIGHHISQKVYSKDGLDIERAAIESEVGNVYGERVHILRFEVAHRVLDIIDIGVFICVTGKFEEYYIGTEKVKRSQIIIFEELDEYLEMISDIITVPLLLIGLKPPSSFM